MENLVFTQLSIAEIRQLLRDELENFFRINESHKSKPEIDEIGGIDIAIEITGLAKPTIYALTSERKIPHSKKGKRLYFSRKELIEWLKAGKRHTESEIAVQAQSISSNQKKSNLVTKVIDHSG